MAEPLLSSCQSSRTDESEPLAPNRAAFGIFSKSVRTQGFVLCWVGLLLASPILADNGGRWPDRGFSARTCGFDMDRDGIFGEPEDCHVCDGTTLVSGAYSHNKKSCSPANFEFLSAP